MRRLLLIAVAWGLACSPDGASEPLPGARLQARVESHLQQNQAILKETLVHYGLVFPVEQADIGEYLSQVRIHGRGTGLAVGTEYALEPHGGGILRFLFDHWRPGSRVPQMEDRFRFAASTDGLELGELYRAQRSQIFLPIPDVSAESLGGRLPDSPQLPRVRMSLSLPGGRSRPIETDSFNLLSLLIEREAEPSRTWINRLGQRLSVDLLLRHVRDHYLSTRDTPGEPDDHSNLHLVELLLAYGRSREAVDPEAIQQRFLAVELARREFDAEDGALILGHYAESLGHLLADPRVRWSEAEKRRVRIWLKELEDTRFPDLAAVEVDGLAHLLRGLRLIESHRERLD